MVASERPSVLQRKASAQYFGPNRAMLSMDFNQIDSSLNTLCITHEPWCSCLQKSLDTETEFASAAHPQRSRRAEPIVPQYRKTPLQVHEIIPMVSNSIQFVPK